MGNPHGLGCLTEFNSDHTAVFEIAEEVSDGQTTRLTVRLTHQHTAEKCLPNWAASECRSAQQIRHAFEREQKRFTVLEGCRALVETRRRLRGEWSQR